MSVHHFKNLFSETTYLLSILSNPLSNCVLIFPYSKVVYLVVLSLSLFPRISSLYLIKFNANIPAGYMFKVNNRSTRARCEICSKLKIKTPKRRQSNIGKRFLRHVLKNVRELLHIPLIHFTLLY